VFVWVGGVAARQGEGRNAEAVVAIKEYQKAYGVV
jgi:hypothetical protein